MCSKHSQNSRFASRKAACNTQATERPALDIEAIFTNGDISTFQSWVMQNMRYPAEAIEKCIQGMVIAQFVVGSDGYIVKDSIKILSDTDPLLNNEVIRVLNISPRWTPGQHAGKSVALQFVIPVSFGLTIN